MSNRVEYADMKLIVGKNWAETANHLPDMAVNSVYFTVGQVDEAVNSVYFKVGQVSRGINSVYFKVGQAGRGINSVYSSTERPDEPLNDFMGWCSGGEQGRLDCKPVIADGECAWDREMIKRCEGSKPNNASNFSLKKSVLLTGRIFSFFKIKIHRAAHT